MLDREKEYFYKLGLGVGNHDYGIYMQTFKKRELLDIFKSFIDSVEVKGAESFFKAINYASNKITSLPRPILYYLEDKEQASRLMLKGCLHRLKQEKKLKKDYLEYERKEYKSWDDTLNYVRDKHKADQTPNYYQVGSKEALEYIADIIKDLQGQEAFCCGNVLKYIIRYKNKNGVEDLKKAKHYIEKLIAINEVKHETK